MRRIHPSGPVTGTLRLPGSKSITNRALLVAALAEGTSRLQGALLADDTEAMIEALGELGVAIRWDGGDLMVEGTGGTLGSGSVNARGSGTTARFITAAAALAAGAVRVDGNARMRRRPIGDLARALNELGAAVEVLGDEDCPPVRVHGPSLAGGAAIVDASRSSQFVSALLMVAPYADRPVVLELTAPVVSRPYIDQTLQVMGEFGATAGWEGESTLVVDTGGYRAREFAVEGDASAAVYPMVAAALCGGRVRVGPFPEDSHQADLALLPVLQRMGATVDRDGDYVRVLGSPTTLAGVTEDMNAAPDAAVALAVACAFASEESRIANIANLRLKESNRIDDLALELRKLGAEVATESDAIRVRPGRLQPAVIDPHDDHRLAMAFAIAGLRLPGVEIRNPDCVAKTWPAFFEDLATITTPLVVAIDGPGGVGKSTVSKGLARRFGLRHLETGGTYRAAALAVLEAHVDPRDEAAVAELVGELEIGVVDGRILLTGRDVSDEVRSEEVSAVSSVVSAYPRVRSALVATQRRWLLSGEGGAVVEGRDIGTVVFPDSPAKVFLTARPEIRAWRRVTDLGLGESDVSRIAEELAIRDERDATRSVSPLRPAEDAVVVDTSDLDIGAVVERVAQIVLHRGDPAP